MKPPNSSAKNEQFVIIGGGPAGLTAAYELTKLNIKPIVLEKLDKVGGISRTEHYKDYYFDMGGHRFFTKSKEVNAFWNEILGDEFLRRPRLSRIYYKQRFFNYPLKPLNALQGLGLVESILIVGSYIRWQLYPYKVEDTFEEWVTNRFGRRLFLTFFKTYTEKVWGISTSELKAEWAAQRIKNLDLKGAVISMFVKPKTKYTTLIDEFNYPRRGPGLMWETVACRVQERGGIVERNTNVVKINRNGSHIVNVVVETKSGQQCLPGKAYISSMPLTELIRCLDPPPPPEVIHAAKQLKYRDFLTVCLVLNKPDLFPDNWIYIHEPGVLVGRIQNFKNWSPHMVPDQTKSSLGLEYFCNEGDELWSMTDEALIELGSREIEKIGLAEYDDVEDGCVFRVEKTYPIYDSGYKNHLEVLKEYLATLENLQTVGRNGLHRYNNQDHAMLTGMLAVRNLLKGEQNNLWVVNAEQDYHEVIREAEINLDGPKVAAAVDEALARAFAKLDPISFGLSSGIMGGMILLVVTLVPVLQENKAVAPMLGLLGHFFPGYTVTGFGSIVGLIYGFIVGFVLGWCVAFLRNTILFLYLAFLQRRAEIKTLGNIEDYIY